MKEEEEEEEEEEQQQYYNIKKQEKQWDSNKVYAGLNNHISWLIWDTSTQMLINTSNLLVL